MVQELPVLIIAPSLHDCVAACEIPLGALHGFGVQLNVNGVRDPGIQLSDAVDG